MTLMSERMWKSITSCEWKGARIMWVKYKIGLRRYVSYSVMSL